LWHDSICKLKRSVESTYDDFLDRNNGLISRTVTEQLKTASPRLPLSNFSSTHSFPLSIRHGHDAGSFFLMDWCGRPRWWRHFLILEEFSQAWRYWSTHPVKLTITIFLRLLEDKVRSLLSDCSCCWVGMSQDTSVLIVGTRFCHQRSHFYSYRYCCPEMKFRLTQLSGGSASTWTGEVAQQRSCRLIQLKYRIVFVPIFISRMCLHCWLCNAQVSSLRWPRDQRVLRGEVLCCDFAKYSELRWRELHNLSVLLCILPSACSWTQSIVTIHSNIDRGLPAVNIGNSGRPWTLKWTRLETWEQKSWVEQRTLRESSFSPIHLFISTP